MQRLRSARVALAVVGLWSSVMASGALAARQPLQAGRTAPAAPEFRTGIEEDARACDSDRAKGGNGGLGCIAVALDRMCADGPEDIEARLAGHVGVPRLSIARALARYNGLYSKHSASACDVPGDGQLRFLAYANRKPKASATGAQPDPDHKALTLNPADPGAFARAANARAALVALTGKDPRAMAGLPVSADAGAAGASSTIKSAGLPANTGGWTNIRDYPHPVGRVNDLLVEPIGMVAERTMWAGTDGGGIWKTTDGGLTWEAKNNGAGSLVISKLRRSAVNPQVLYAATNPDGAHATGPYGIMKSTDNGASWNQLGATSPDRNTDFLQVNDLAVHPTGVSGQDVLLAAVAGAGAGGIYVSNDSGNTWTKVSANAAGAAVLFHPTDANRRAYALHNGQVFVTANGIFGAAPTSTLTTGQDRAFVKLAWAKSDPRVLLALYRDAASITFLVRSEDTGATWIPVALPDALSFTRNELFYTGAVWIDPTNPKRIAAAEIWAGSTADMTTATKDDGWKRLATGWTDFHGIVADPEYNGTTNKTVYFTDDGGVYRYNDVDAVNERGDVVSVGMAISEVYSVAGRSGGNILMAPQDVSPRVHRPSADDPNAGTWQPIVAATGGTWFGDGVGAGVSRQNPKILFGSRQYLDLFRSDDGGLNAVAICGTAPTNLTEGDCARNQNARFLSTFIVDPNKADNLYAGGRSLWRSQNATGATPAWAKILSVDDSFIDAIALAPSDSNTLIASVTAADGPALHRTTNASAPTPTFTRLASAGLPLSRVISVMVDRTNVNNIWVGVTFGGVYFSSNGGASFSAVAGVPQTTVFALAQHPANPSYLYAGTQVGLFASSTKGATWGASNEGPANAEVRDLQWYSENAQSAVLLVATYGRGVWRAMVDAAPASVVTAFEFLYQPDNRYFLTIDAAEANAIDGGAAGPGWQRTGFTFKAYGTAGDAPAGAVPVCRFYGSVNPGPNSHFFTASAAECQSLKDLQATTPVTQKRWNYEGIAFRISEPGVARNCASGLVPVYRAYNNGFTRGIDSNHRFTTSQAEIQKMVAQGWANEGIVFCSPQ